MTHLDIEGARITDQSAPLLSKLKNLEVLAIPQTEITSRGLADIEWDDVTEYAPAVVAAVTMPLTYSIATGIGLGFITYALVKLAAGKLDEAKPAVLVLAVIFAIKFALPD